MSTAWQTWPPKGVETVEAFHLPLVNTLTLLLSGTTVTWAHHALQVGDRKSAKIGLVLTIILGALFTGFRHEYRIIQHNLFFNEEAAHAGLYGSGFFMATGFHGFHVLIGTIFLTICLFRLLGKGFTPEAALRLRSGGLVLALRGRGLAVPLRLHLRRVLRRTTALTGVSTARTDSGGQWPPRRSTGLLAAARAAARASCSAAISSCAALPAAARPAFADSGDGPAIFVIFLVAPHVMLALIMGACHPSPYVHLMLWIATTCCRWPCCRPSRACWSLQYRTTRMRASMTQPPSGRTSRLMLACSTAPGAWQLHRCRKER